MKFFCEKNKIVDALTNVSYAISARATIPALEGVLIIADENNLTLQGYDLELAITTTIDAKVEEPGKIVLTAKILLDMLRKIPAEQIQISSDERLLTSIQGGMTNYSLLGLPAQDFPELPALEEKETLVVDKGLLQSMIAQTLYAVAVSNERPVQMGAKFDLEDGVLYVAGVDGYRLALRQEPINNEQSLSFIVPGKSLHELLKLLNNQEGDVEIHLSNSHVIFRLDKYTILTRLIKGEFIQYRNTLPKESKQSFIVNTREIIDALDRALLLINSNIKSPLKMTFMEGKILFSCSTTLGRINDEVSSAGYTGESVEAGFNCKYMLDALRAAGVDQVRISFKDPLAPLKITPVEGESFLFLVLPVRLHQV